MDGKLLEGFVSIPMPDYYKMKQELEELELKAASLNCEELESQIKDLKSKVNDLQGRVNYFEFENHKVIESEKNNIFLKHKDLNKETEDKLQKQVDDLIAQLEPFWELYRKAKNK